MLSRRAFLQRTSVVSLSPVLPHVLARTARAATPVSDSRVLVVIQLDGGNDGLNTVVPFGDDAYAQVRDKLRLDVDKLHKLNDHVGLHSYMRAARHLFDEGRLAIVQGVGYPNPDRSHFRSMRIWQTARFDDDQHDGYGWLGRALDLHSVGVKDDATSHDATSHAIFVGQQETPVALWGRRSSATALTRLEDLQLHSALPSDPSYLGSTSGSGDLAQFVTRQLLDAYASADEIEHLTSGSSRSIDYPDTELATRLKLVSQLLQSGSKSRVFYTVQSGYDTHSAQRYTHARLLRELADALKAFLDDLQTARIDDRVCVLAFSEFGRRVKENDSQGTDHGTAGPVFLAGQPVNGGLIGDPPNLTDLEGGDLKMQIDFRRLYSTVLHEWLGIDPRRILSEEYDPLSLFSS